MDKEALTALVKYAYHGNRVYKTGRADAIIIKHYMKIFRNINAPQIVSKNSRRIVAKLLHPAPVKRGGGVVVPVPAEETLAVGAGLLVDEPELLDVLVVLDSAISP
jgi:hypothetical protein